MRTAYSVRRVEAQLRRRYRQPQWGESERLRRRSVRRASHAASRRARWARKSRRTTATEREVASTKPQPGMYTTLRSWQQSNTQGKVLAMAEDGDADINGRP
jgi:hypothetical protein